MYVVTVNLRNRVRIHRRPELMMCLRWALDPDCFGSHEENVNKGGTAQVFHSLSSLDL